MSHPALPDRLDLLGFDENLIVERLCSLLNGTSLVTLSHKIGISSQSIYHWREGSKHIFLHNVVAISDALGIYSTQLLYGVTPPLDKIYSHDVLALMGDSCHAR